MGGEIVRSKLRDRPIEPAEWFALIAAR